MVFEITSYSNDEESFLTTKNSHQDAAPSNDFTIKRYGQVPGHYRPSRNAKLENARFLVQCREQCWQDCIYLIAIPGYRFSGALPVQNAVFAKRTVCDEYTRSAGHENRKSRVLPFRLNYGCEEHHFFHINMLIDRN